jgi:hypothetical protein
MDNPGLRRAVERLWEDESLTAALTDPAARLLLEWGTNRAEAILLEMADHPERRIVRRLAALRRLIRRLARLAGQAPPDRQLEQIKALLNTTSGERRL